MLDDPRSRALTRRDDAEAALRTGRPDRGNELARRAVADARAALDSPVLPPAASERLEAAVARPGAVDGGLLDLVEDVTAALAGAYYSSPPAVLLPAARAHLDRVLRLSFATSGRQARRRSTSLLSDAAALAGWLSLDAGRAADSIALLTLSRESAREAGDTALYWLAVASLALARTNLATADPKAATYALRQAASQMPADAPAEARTWVRVHAAKEHAAVGDRGRFRHLMEMDSPETRGRVRLGGFYSPDGWFADVAGGEWVADCAARGLAFLGHPSAPDALRLALSTGGDARRRATLLSTLSGHLAQCGEPEEAARTAVQALDAARGLPLWSERVRGLRRRLDPWATLPAVRDLDAALAA